jgi:serine protease Do
MDDALPGTAFDRELKLLPPSRFLMMLIPFIQHPRLRSAWLSLGLVVGTIGCTQADLPFPIGGPGAAAPSFAPVVREVMPAVVNVSAVQKATTVAAQSNLPDNARDRLADRLALRNVPSSVLDELLKRFFEARSGKAAPKVASVAVGSGFIIDPSGYVVTDDHVVVDAEKVTIVVQGATDQGATEYAARVVGRDPLTDLALLKIDATGPFSHVRWGDSDGAQIGDWVLAIGSPFGLDNTVSSGIISGRGRDIHAGPYDDFLQIDAAMNRGNSGGPTFDLHGDVIGINTAIYSPNGGSVGIGFAIPANRAKPVIEQLKRYGKVARGWLGIQIQQVTPEIAHSLGLPKPEGVLVAKVGPDSPAAAAGFQRGDVLLSISGQNIRRLHDLPLVVAEMPIGRMAAVTVWRGNAALSLRPIIGEMPAGPEVAEWGRSQPDGRPSQRTSNSPPSASSGSLAI